MTIYSFPGDGLLSQKGSISMQKRLLPSSLLFRSGVTVFCFCLLIFGWGLFPIVTKLGVENAPPLFFSAARLLLAAGIMALVNSIGIRPSFRMRLHHHWQALLLGFFISGFPTAAFAVAVHFAPASISAVIWATSPILTALFAGRGSGEPGGRRLFISMTLGMLGIGFVLVSNASSFMGFSKGGGPGNDLPVLLSECAILAAAALSAFAMRLARRSVEEIPVFTLTTWQVCYGGLFIAFASLLFEHGQVQHLSAQFLWPLLYAAIICSCGCNLLTFWLIGRIGIVRTAYSDFVVPAVTLVLAAVLLREAITLFNVGGVVLVFSGTLFLAKMPEGKADPQSSRGRA